ncbi:MAG: tandem-95 repeat protein [Thermoplasmata archaeon]
MAFDIGKYLYDLGDNLIEFGLTASANSTEDVNISIFVDNFQVKGLNGMYISKIYDAGSEAFWENVTWNAELPPSTNVTLRTRTSMDSILWSSYSAPLAYNKDNITNPIGRYIQYEAIFKTLTLGVTPILKDINITYTKYSNQGTIAFNNDLIAQNVTNWGILSSNASLKGQNIRFEYSIDSGANWYQVPGDGNLSFVITSLNKIRFKAILEALNTSLTPTLYSMNLTYSVNRQPVIIGVVPNQSQPEDGGPWTLDLTPYESDYEDTGDKLRWFITGENNSLYALNGEYSADDVFTFTTIPDAYGNNQVTLWLGDNMGARASQTLWINITPVNDAPEIQGVLPSFDKNENDPNWQLDLSGYKYDKDNSMSELSWSAFGWDTSLFDSISIASDIITFDLATDAYGNDEITIVLTDAMNADSQNIWVNVTLVNKPPVINGTIPSFNVMEDEPAWVLNLTSYEKDREDPYPSTDLVWSILGVNNSLLSVSISDNNITFNPIPNAYGTNQITMVLTDSYGAIDYQEIWVNVTPENDMPQIVGIIPSFEKNEDATNWSLDLSSYKNDVDNLSSELSWQILGWDASLFDSVVVNGDVITFDLAPDAYGNNQITIILSDGLLNNTQNIWVNVTTMNDAPSIVGIIPDFNKNEDDLPWILNLTSYERDIEDGYPSPSLIWSVVDFDSNLLTVSVSDNNLTFTLKPDAYGNDEIKIILTDSNGATASYNIWVNVTPFNDAPMIVGIIPSFEKNEDAVNWNLDLFTYKYDVDNSSSELSWQISGWDTSLFDLVSVNQDVITFDLAPDAYGTNQITITLSDGLLTDTQDIWVNVTSINDAPTIADIIPDFYRNEDDTSWTFNLTTYEWDVEDVYPSSSLTWMVVDIDSYLLSVSVSDNNITFTLMPDAYGNDEITIILTDSNGATDSQIIWVNVTADNDQPKILGVIPSFNKGEDASNWNIDLSPYKFDVDNTPLELLWSISGWDPALFDSVSLVGDVLTFDLASNAYGNNEITITLTDGLLYATQNIWVNVTAVNDDPVIIGTIPNMQKLEDDQSWTLDLTAYESDEEDGSPSASLTWSVSGVNTSLISITILDNDLTFTLVPDAYGNNYITIILTDSGGLTDSQGVWVEITSVNDPPTIQSTLPNIILNEDTSTVINLFGYGSDIEDSPGQLRWSLTGTNGSLYSWQIDPATNMLYINPLPDAFGSDDTILTLLDSGGATDSKTLQVLIIPVNDAPYIYPQVPESYFGILEDQPISIILTGFENDVEDTNDQLEWEVRGVDSSIIKVSVDLEKDELVIVPVVAFSPDDSESVETEITLVLVDSGGLSTQQNITVTIIPVNNAPVISELPNLVIKYNKPFIFDLAPYLFDEDTRLDQLVVTTSEPSTDTGNGYIVVNGLNLTFNYPVSSLYDTFSVLVTLSDGQLTTYAIMQVTVSDHTPPELQSPIPDVSFDEDSGKDTAFDLDDHFIGYEDGPLNYTFYMGYTHHGNEYVFVIINSDNTVDFSAAQDWYGVEQITFRAEDNYGAKAEYTITVTVNPVDDPPVILDIPDQECKVNESKILDLEPFISDVDTPKEDLMIATDSPYITIQSHNLIFYYNNITKENVNILVMDGTSQDGITIQVTALPNSPPSISSVPELIVRGGEVYLFSLLPYVSDRDNEIEDLQIWTDSNYIDVNPYDNMLLQIDFPADMVGDDVLVTVYISDGLDSNSTEMLIHITNELIPKLVNGLPNLFFAEDTLFIDALDLNDYFENIIDYQYFGNENVNITIVDGLVSLSAPENWSGSEIITFRGILGDAFVEDTIDVVVKPVNDPPVLSQLPSYDKKVNEIWALNLYDYIQDIDTPVADLVINVDSPYVIFYALNIYFQYPFQIYDQITVTVSDGENSVSNVIHVNVTADNNPPMYRGLEPTYHFKPGEIWSIDLDNYFYDIDGDGLIFSCNKEEIIIDPITHTATWTPGKGEYTLDDVVFSADDGSETIDSSPIDLVLDVEKSTPSFFEQYWWLFLLIALLTSALIALALMKRREEVEEIEYAIPVDKAVEYLVTEGRGNYLIKSQTSDSAYKIFSGLIQSGFEGLCITTKRPKDLTNQYELGKAWIIKLALRGEKTLDGDGEETKMVGLLALGDEERDEDKYIFSSNFKCIVETIEEFIIGGDHKVVLLDGLEYILGGEELIMYMGFIASLKERLKDKNSCLLIPIDPKTLSEKELGLLERETIHLGKALQESAKRKPDALGIDTPKKTEVVAASTETEDIPPPPI